MALVNDKLQFEVLGRIIGDLGSAKTDDSRNRAADELRSHVSSGYK